VENANPGLEKIFDADKERNRLKAAEIGAQVADIARTEEQIHNMTTTKGPDGKDVVNTQANLMALAVLGAVVAQINGNSALAGAAGATTGEFIAQQLYPGVPREQLSEDQKQNISALATLAAGLAGGIVGDSTADAVAGAQAGKNSSNKNNLGGLGSYGQATASLGSSMIEAGATTEEIDAALSKNAKGDLLANQNPATGLLTAWGAGMTTVVAPALLPAPATAGSVIAAGAIGGSANVFNQLNSGDPFSATDALIATGVSALTQGKGFWFTEAASITGAYAGAKLQGKYTLPVVAGAVIGTVIGAGGGKAVEVGNKYFPLVSVKTAGIAGTISGSVISEATGIKVEDKLKNAGGR
jgi:filamentous hemagglutinin